MKIAVISDTHDNEFLIRNTIASLKDKNIKTIIHCGDLTSLNTLDYFKDFDLKLVKGNCDHYEEILQQKLNKNYLGHIGKIEINNNTIMIYHGNEKELLNKLIKNEHFDLFLTGHTHQRTLRKIDSKIILNPGALEMTTQDNSFAIVKIPNDKKVNLNDITFYDPKDITVL
jgi:putative phosphoesterase